MVFTESAQEQKDNKAVLSYTEPGQKNLQEAVMALKSMKQSLDKEVVVGLIPSVVQ